MALNYVNITETFSDGSQTPVNGTVTFTPSATVYASGIPLVSTNTPVTTSITNGTLAAVKLLATDNSGLTFEGLTGFFYWTASVTIDGITQSWSFFLPHTPTTVDLYSLANTAAGGSSGFTNPMTTLGDIIYENATPAAARLAGPTSGVLPYVLTSTPSGGVAQAPAWSSYFDQPWQFRPEAYGAKGNGKIVGDVTTNGTTTITSASANFTNADVGKYVMIHGANGNTGTPVITTIASVTNSTTAILTAPAGASVTNCPMVYGTDDVAAINAAVTAAGTYATTVGATPGSGGYFAEILFGSKIYILGSGPTQVGNGTNTPTFNAQIPLPYPNANGTTQKLVIALTGAGDAGYCQYWESVIPNVSGSALVSMTTAPSSPNGTFGNQSVIGGPSGGAGFTGLYANTKVVVKGLSVWCSIYTNQFAFDFGYVTAMRVQQSSAHIFAPTGVNSAGIAPWLKSITATALLSSIGTGFRTPVNGNNDDVTMDDVTVEGYECGFRIFDHFDAVRLATIFTDVCVFFNGAQGASGTAHGLFIHSISAEDYNGGLLTNGGACQVDINWDAEGIPTNYDISDAGNALYGTFRYGDKIDNNAPVINGAAHLKVINCNQAPGYWSGAPAVPANNTNQQNTAWRDAWVTITSGGAAVTAITIDGQATGLSLGTSGSVAVRVPSGKNINLTYASTAPTWKWWLD